MKEPNLLDVFAALAMHALLHRVPDAEPQEISEVAFEIARAMLKESIEAEHGKPN